MINQIFFRPAFNDFIKVFKIETHRMDGKKKVKLDREIYNIEYLLNYKPPFTTYREEVERMISFDRWIAKN